MSPMFTTCQDDRRSMHGRAEGTAARTCSAKAPANDEYKNERRFMEDSDCKQASKEREAPFAEGV
jgi:hypothetical protein